MKIRLFLDCFAPEVLWEKTKMKKIMGIVFCLAFILIFFGFKKWEKKKIRADEAESVSEFTELQQERRDDEKVDIDLSSLSSTMVFAQIFNIVIEPEKYNGKKIRMKGVVSIFNDAERKNSFYACIVKDATACCSQGFDFVLSEEAALGGYPVDGKEITLTGTFRELMEGDISHYMITEANWR